MTILLGLLCFIFYTKPVQKISYENNVIFGKNLYISSPVAANSIVSQGAALSGNIEIENLLMNTTYSPTTNITSFGSSNPGNKTIITFTNLPDGSLATNALSYLGLNNSGQLCIYKENTPPDTLSQETIHANIINGNNLDTLFIKNPDGTIIIGNTTGNVYFYSGVSIANSVDSSADKITFSSDIDTKNIITNALKTNNLQINSSNITFNTETTTLNNVTNTGIITCGSKTNPILNTTATISDGSLTINTFDEKTEANITVSPIETTNNPSINMLAINDKNQVIQLKENSFLNASIKEIALCDNFTATNITNTDNVNLTINNGIKWQATLFGQTFLNIYPTGSIIISGQTDMLGFQVKDNFIENITCTAERIRLNIIAKEIEIKALNINNNIPDIRFVNTRTKQLYNIEDFPNNQFYWCLAKPPQIGVYYDISASATQFTTKNKEKIAFEEPKIFSYKKTYTEDICPKSKTQKRRIGFISQDSYLEILDKLSNYYKDLELKLKIDEQEYIAMISELDKKIEKIQLQQNQSFFDSHNIKKN
jgi:hypothetical protein